MFNNLSHIPRLTTPSMQRDTNQRKAIREALMAADRPLSPQELLDAAQSRVPGMGMATVYRTVKGLLEENWLVPVDLPGEPPRYEVAGKPHHHHFRCEGCGRVYEVHGCPGSMDNLVPEGFKLRSHQITLVGICGECTGGHDSLVPSGGHHAHSHSHGHHHHPGSNHRS
jgi:Fur family transcriptional regulator, ferric uptake regulator